MKQSWNLSRALRLQVTIVLIVLGILDSPVTLAAAPITAPPGTPLAEVLEKARADGLPLVWSSSLVPARLRVENDPGLDEPEALLRALLAPHGLSLSRVEGVLLVVRADSGAAAPYAGSSLVLIVRDENKRLFDAPVDVQVLPAIAPAQWRDTAGLVQFDDVPAGHYVVRVSAQGYQAVERGVQVLESAPATVQITLSPAMAHLENLLVSASRYLLFSSSQFFIDQRAIQNLPDIGEDPIRSVHRLPGTAAGGWSAKSHFRGGLDNETAIFLNGLRLLDPFHVRDFHNVFSSIDSRTITGVEAYTGGFPAIYGDRLSGILLLQTLQAEKPRTFELGVSVFNTSLLTSGFSDNGRLDWLVSARRSNLQYVLDSREHGKPAYNDLFASLGVNVNRDFRLTFNVLRAKDDVLVITEHKPEDREFSVSDTLNRYAWVQIENHWSDRLFSQTVLSTTAFSNDREAVIADPEQLVGEVQDEREVKVHGLRQDWSLLLSDAHLLEWGWEFRAEDAAYRYLADARYFDDYLVFPGVPERVRRDIAASPNGRAWSVYLSDRWQLTPDLVAQAGLRWDRQTWQGPSAGDQLSPRLNLYYNASEWLDLRLTWGRYHQSQGINELQVSDGIERFFPSQSANHFILGARWSTGHKWSFRAEVFDKRYDRLIPRFENFLDPLPLIPELEVDRIRVAPDSARSVGLELTVEHEGGPGLSWWASYTLSRATDRVENEDVPRNWDQRHAVQAGISWESGPWVLGAAINAHSGWPTTRATLVGDTEEDPRVVFGPRNRDTLNSFFSLDARLARTWALPRGKLSAWVEVTNLTDHANECCVDYDIEEDDNGDGYLERSVDHWLGITPALGLLWEF